MYEELGDTTYSTLDLKLIHFPSRYFDDTSIPTDKPVYIDAVNPKRFYTHGQAKHTIRKLAAGFRKAGLKKGDVVCIHSFSDVGHHPSPRRRSGRALVGSLMNTGIC